MKNEGEEQILKDTGEKKQIYFEKYTLKKAVLAWFLGWAEKHMLKLFHTLVKEPYTSFFFFLCISSPHGT